MSLSDLSSRSAVLSAIAEFDRLGRDAFLAKYGFGPAQRYFLDHAGQLYDSKAIAGVAHGYQFRRQGPLRSAEFSGGESTVQQKLEELGFSVLVLEDRDAELRARQRRSEVPNFIKGQTYRRRDIHARFGGQRQGGISTPADHPVILCFTGEQGEQYGYGGDGWTSDGVFLYTGEGQRGDMTFVRGNLAIRDHVLQGRDLHMFGYVGSGTVRYLGPMVCAGFEWREAPDLASNQRQAIVFQLVPMEAFQSSAAQAEAPEPSLDELSLDELRRRAEQDTRTPRPPREAKRRVFDRSAAVRAYVLRRADGHCEACGQPAPFTTSAGLPYLEPHHIRRVSDGGPDDPAWVAGVCPNCHRRAHYSADREEFNHSLSASVHEKESRLAGTAR
jgi:5-methylcytosine-specific restriction protein A